MTAYAEYDDLLVYGSFDEDNPEEELLSALLETASRVIDNRCGRTFAPGETVLPHYFDRESIEGRVLYLDGDLCGDIVVENNGIALTEDIDYVLHPRNGVNYSTIRLLEGGWIDPVVTGDWCYSQAPPVDIAHCCMRLACWMYHQRDSGAVNQPIMMANGVIVMPAKLPEDVEMMLSCYRRFSV